MRSPPADHLPPGSYTIYDKDGMSGRGGYSAYVAMTPYQAGASPGDPAQAGVFVVVNKAFDGGKKTPTKFGQGVLGYLVGGQLPDWGAPDDGTGEAEPMDDSDPVSATA